MDIKEQVFQIAKNAREAMPAVANLSSAEKDDALVEMAEQLIHHMDYLIEENEKDVEYARRKGLSKAMLATHIKAHFQRKDEEALLEVLHSGRWFLADKIASLELIIKQKYESLKPYMDERMRRVWAAAEAKALGRGGISAVSLATGLTRRTIRAGLCEHQEQLLSGEAPAQRVRRPGGGRKRITEQDVQLLVDLESLVDPQTRGDPQSPLRWTCKSTSKLATELQAMGHVVGERTVARLLQALDYSLQANRKLREGSAHPDRNQQFEHM